jgi:putative endonuclease
MSEPAGRASHRRRLGARGERRAADWYVGAGYEVVARNWRCRDGEIDLVVARPGELVFCEVKTRSSQRFGSPAEAVTPAKQARLRRLAARFLAEHGSDVRRGWSVRFDVVAITAGHTEVIEGAF